MAETSTILVVTSVTILCLIFVFIVIAVAFAVMAYNQAHDNGNALHALTGIVNDVSINYLFFIGSDQLQHVTITQDVPFSRTITVVLATMTSAFHTFTDVPKHENYDMGNLRAADIMMNASANNPVNIKPFSDKDAQVIDNLINSRPTSFVDQLPNCTISVTKNGETKTYIDTIARMESIHQVNDNTEITFHIHSGEKLIEQGSYEYISIIVDDFWDVPSLLINNDHLDVCKLASDKGVGDLDCAKAIVVTAAEVGIQLSNA